MTYQSPLVDRLCSFLIETAGLTVRPAPIADPTFLPGLTIFEGAILVDESRLLYPGDLLHEGGHLAIMTPAERACATAPLDVNPGLELSAIAWSYAAARHLQIDPAIVFHDGGYREGSESLLENFSEGRYIGVPLLQWMGMTSAKSFPEMSRWLRPD